MGLTLSFVKGQESVFGNMRRNTFDVTFDSSYPDGGESLTPRSLYLSKVTNLQVVSQRQGYDIEYDLAAQKLKAYRQSPYVVIEATGTFTAGAAYTCKNRPAYVIGIRGTAGSTGAKRLIPTGETLAAGQCSLDFTTGVITWGDATITAAIIMYIPMGVIGFEESRLVVDEAVTLADITGGFGAGTLANRAALINYIWNDEDNEVLTYVPVAENPGANEVDIDINSAGSTVLRVLTSDIGNGAAKLKATYIKYDAGIHERLLQWVDQADMVLATNVLGPGTGGSAAATAMDVPAIVIPGFGQAVVGEATTTNKFALFVDSQATSAAGVVLYDPWRNVWTGHANEGFTTIELPLLYVPSELAGSVMLEVPEGSDLSALRAIRVLAEGY